MRNQTEAAVSGAVLRRIPGKVRAREDALREYQQANAAQRDRLRRDGRPPLLVSLLAPGPEDQYRWRIQLDCGCTKEVLTSGDKTMPAETQWSDGEQWLPAGQMICSHARSTPVPYRDVEEWRERREISLPADQRTPPAWADEQTWALLRRDEPHTSAFWTVLLSCGHVTEVCCDLGWAPADGPSLVSIERQQEMIADFEEFWASRPETQDEGDTLRREHIRRMLAQRCPMPEPEHWCFTCPEVQLIVAYQRIGWLIPRKSEQKPRTPSRETLERRLRQAQAEAERLRKELAQLDGDGGKTQQT